MTSRCLYLLSDILMIGLCAYLTGGTDYEDMRTFALERGDAPGDMLSLSNGVPSTDIHPVELEYRLVPMVSPFQTTCLKN